MNNSSLISNQIVKDRKSLDEQVQRALKQLPTGEGKAIINFWGCPGEGRTTLLEHLKNLLEETNLIKTGMWDIDKISVDELIGDIQKWLENVSGKQTKVILIDNLRALLPDGEDNPNFVQFEHNLVSEIVNRNDVLLVIASQHEIRQWHELLVRMRQISYLIPPITQEEFIEIARAKEIEHTTAFKLSLGHPAPLDWISNNPKISIEKIDAQAIIYFLRDFESGVVEEARVLSLLLQFDEVVMERALRAAKLGQGKTYFDLLDSIRKMGFAGLLFHDIRMGAYRFTDSSVRRLLARGYRRENAEKFQLVHEAIWDYYREASLRPSSLQNNLCSAIYHLAWCTKLKDENVVDHCVEWVDQMLSSWKGADWEETWLAWLSGQEEPATISELRELLSDKGYNKLSRMFKAIWRESHE